jgi:hypothetical protein
VNSVRPWNALIAATTRIFAAPYRSCAYRRASLSAASLASAPELQKNTRSAKVASIEALREPQRWLVREPVRDVPDLPGLLRQRTDERRMAVAERGDGHAAREVDVHPAVLVPDARAFPAHGE